MKLRILDIKYLCYALVAVSAITSCDEGRLYVEELPVSEEGGNIHVRLAVKGEKSWPDGYTLAVAGFKEGNEYALVSKNIETGLSGGVCDILLGGIPSEVTSIELCALDRLRRRVAVFASADYNNGGEFADWNPAEGEEIDLSMAGAIQREVFNTTCVQCHGGSNHAAAGLNLTEGRSFGELVSMESVKNPGLKRVQPGKSELSLLYLILSEGYSTFWNYDHSVEVVRQEKLDLIRNWIDGGAQIKY